MPKRGKIDAIGIVVEAIDEKMANVCDDNPRYNELRTRFGELAQAVSAQLPADARGLLLDMEETANAMHSMEVEALMRAAFAAGVALARQAAQVAAQVAPLARAA